MEELLALLERYSPGYRDTVQGVFDWRLEDLEEAFGRPLPAFYKDFARTMGLQAGPLLAHVNAHEPLHVKYPLSGKIPARRGATDSRSRGPGSPP